MPTRAQWKAERQVFWHNELGVSWAQAEKCAERDCARVEADLGVSWTLGAPAAERLGVVGAGIFAVAANGAVEREATYEEREAAVESYNRRPLIHSCVAELRVLASSVDTSNRDGMVQKRLREIADRVEHAVTAPNGAGNFEIPRGYRPARLSAEHIAEALFTNGSGQRASRLVLTVDGDPPRNLGGWCVEAAADAIFTVLVSMAAHRRRSSAQ